MQPCVGARYLVHNYVCVCALYMCLQTSWEHGFSLEGGDLAQGFPTPCMHEASNPRASVIIVYEENSTKVLHGTCSRLFHEESCSN